MAYCQFLSQDHGGGGGREGGISFKSSLNLQSSLQTAAKKLSKENPTTRSPSAPLQIKGLAT